VLLLAVGRALDSGPVEAWYVDTVHRLDSSADVAPGLAKHSAADGGGLAVGAVAGGLLPAVFDGDLAVPFLLAAALNLVFIAAVLPLLHEQRPPRQGTARAALLTGARETPATVGAAVRLSVTDGPLRLVLLLTAAGGAGLVACELLGPVRFAELAGGRDDGAAVYGTVLASAFAAASLAALAATPLRRLLRGSTRAACAALAVLGGLSLVALAGPDLLPVAAVAFVGYYVAHGANWPLLSAVLHGRVTAAHRATAVSAMSLAMAVGGLLGNLLIPLIPRNTAFITVGTLVALSALTCWRLPSQRQEGLVDEPRADGKDPLDGPTLAAADAAGQHQRQIATPSADST
jgi:hypothetical protein